MPEPALSSLRFFHPLVQKWFQQRFGAPTGVQRQVWPSIAQGQSVLATAPTGSGKTLAAFLWAINQLATGAWPGGQVRVLYISPLRALNNDIRLNLLEPLGELQRLFEHHAEPFAKINVITRSGDTEAAERRRMIKHRPEILITTPESLNLLINSHQARGILTGVRTVILDEIHAIAGDKRGAYLMSAVERLSRLAGEFHRIALSATVEPLATIAQFIGGYRLEGETYVPRAVEIIRSQDRKQIDLAVSQIPRAQGSQDSVWSVLADELRAQLDQSRSTLVFVNNRRLSERVCHLINEQAQRMLAYSHHGSLSRELRALVEQRLKKGELAAIVATNSLELGIDIGSVEQVLLVQTPRTLNSAIQRVGRAGHSVGAVSRARLFPTHSSDLLDAAVVAPLICQQRPQQVRPVLGPLDVLAQVCLAMCGIEPWDADELYRFLRTCHTFHHLSREAFDLVIRMLQGRYGDAKISSLRPRLQRNEDGRLAGRDGVMTLIHTSGGVIPDRGYFGIRVKGSRGVLGQLDEEFVWERKVGDEFRVGMQTWRIERINHNDVEVVPVSKASAGVPFWRGEAEDRDHWLCEQIGSFLERADGQLDSPAFHQALIDEHRFSKEAVEDLVDYLHRQRGVTGCSLPHRHHVVIEHYSPAGAATGSSQMIIHACWGGSVLRPWAIALAAAWEERFGSPIEVFTTDDCLMLQVPGNVDAREVVDLVAPGQLEPLLRKKLESTGFFGARFRENAARALLLPRQQHRRMPLWLNRLRAKKLLQQVSRYPDFPVIAETWRECIQDHFECDRLRELLQELRDGQISISQTTTQSPSPFAASLVWRSTSEYMYAQDRPFDATTSSLSEQMLRQVLHDAALRPLIPDRIIEALAQRLHRTLPGYAPETPDELADVVNERIAIPQPQWQSLLAAVGRDHGIAIDPLHREMTDRIVCLLLPDARVPVMVAAERLPRLLRASERSIEACQARHPDGTELDDDRLAQIAQACRAWRAPEGEDDALSLLSGVLADMLSFQGPLSLAELHGWLGIPSDRLEAALAEVVEEGRVVFDQLREGIEESEYCDSENLERLLRLLRLSHRPQLEAHPAAELPLLPATLQGLTARGQTIEHLQDRLERLFGYPALAELWETAILPARVNAYSPHWIDALMQSSDLMWLGCGKQDILLCFRQDLGLFHARPHGHSDLLPAESGRYDFFALQQHTGLSSEQLTRKLWEQSWKGLITNDTFATLRKGIENRFEPSELPATRSSGRLRAGFAAWQSSRPLVGNWHAVTWPAEEPDRLEQIEADKDRVRQVLARYGVIFREMLAKEPPPLRWSRLLPALRLMELSGEVLAGQFFTGIAGLQFASHEALRLLQHPLNEEAVFWMNAADPASLCGIDVEGLEHLPARQTSTLLIFHGHRLVIAARRSGKELDVRVPPDSPDLPRYLEVFREQFARSVMPISRLAVEVINDQPAPRSPYAAPLKAYGFASDYKTLTLYRQY